MLIIFNKGAGMKAAELENLKIYSYVLSDDIVRIAVLSFLLDNQIRQIQSRIGLLKGYINELENAGQNH